MLKVLFLDDEPNVLRAIRRTTRPMQGQWDLFFESNAHDALALFDRVAFDVVVTDMRMPSMDGAEFLERVRRRSPRTARIVLSGYAEEEAALRSSRVAHQFLSKPCRLEALTQTIFKIARTQEAIASDAFEDLVGGVASLPALPSVYVELTSTLNDPDASSARIAEVISRDVGLTTTILHAVNSSFFGMAQHVDSIEMAVSLLGRTVVTSITLAQTLFHPADEPNLTPVSSRAFEVGAIARLVALERGMSESVASQLFLRGMIHEVGMLVFAQTEMSRADLQYLAERIDLVQDRALVGIDRYLAGAHLLGLWGFDMEMVEAVANLGTPRHDVAFLSPFELAHEIVLRGNVRAGELVEASPAERALLLQQLERSMTTRLEPAA